MPRGYRPYALDKVTPQEQWWQTSARDTSQWGPIQMRESFKPPPDNGLPDWLSKQTAPRVANPPTARPEIPAYCGHAPLVQVEMHDEITAKAGEPQVRLRAPNIVSAYEKNLQLVHHGHICVDCAALWTVRCALLVFMDIGASYLLNNFYSTNPD